MECLNESTLSVEEAHKDFFEQRSIREQCTKESLTYLREAFLASENEQMTALQLQDAFRTMLEIDLSEEKFNILFQQMDMTQNGYVTWDEFISYLLVEFQETDSKMQRERLELPILGRPRLLRSHHRTAICKIVFYPEVSPTRTTSFSKGWYLTVTKEGAVNYWSLDLEFERTAQAKNPFLKVQPTSIIDMIVLPDIQIVCTSSTECDLRFYDTSAKKFDLRIMISSLRHAVICMSYYFSADVSKNSYIILGDTSGSIIIMNFNSIDRGSFKQNPERDTLFIRYQAVLNGELKGMNVIEIKHMHTDWVNQVAYYESLRAFISSSRCSNCSLLLMDPMGSQQQYKFKVNMGISCFTFHEESQMLITGGADCIVRVWNPYVPKRPNAIFRGHHAAICAIVIQDNGEHIYSLSKDKCIKVWDVLFQTCIQTYNGLQNEIGDSNAMTIVYNALTHQMVIASTVIAVVICEPVINPELSDGFAHIASVSCILYNHLYNLIVTTGADSCIIIWDPWLGRRLNLITNAHSRLLYGQHHSIEITAACFDNSEQLLVTGACDGTLKIWNFNTGTCLRNVAIEGQCEITSIVCIENRILCSGWNRQIVEFALSATDTYQKSWGTKHTDDILCSAVKYPQVLATGTYNGEIILWRLETGQPFRVYKVYDMTARCATEYNPKNKEQVAKFAEKKSESKMEETSVKNACVTDSAHHKSALNVTRMISVRAMIFLTVRIPCPRTGTLLVSLESGLIQVWSHHPAGGFLESFSVIHTLNDCALSLATDPGNYYLITGHRAGYLKVWLLGNYLIPNPPKISMVKLRLEFPFLRKSKIDGRAKRAVRDQPLPVLLSSVRGHLKAVTSIQLIPRVGIIVSGSTDRTVRLWSMAGRFISSLGTFLNWVPLLPTIPVSKYFKNFKLPPDVKKWASSTTVKVLLGDDINVEKSNADIDFGNVQQTFSYENRLLREKTIFADRHLKSRPTPEQPVLDNSSKYIPIYAHLVAHPLNAIEKPKFYRC